MMPINQPANAGNIIADKFNFIRFAHKTKNPADFFLTENLSAYIKLNSVPNLVGGVQLNSGGLK